MESNYKTKRQCLTLYVVLFQVYPFQQWDEIGSTFPCSILGSGQNVPSRQGDGNALLLQGTNRQTVCLITQTYLPFLFHGHKWNVCLCLTCLNHGICAFKVDHKNNPNCVSMCKHLSNQTNKIKCIKLYDRTSNPGFFPHHPQW